MAASPKIAIDLPLKALNWQHTEGKAWLSHNSPDYLLRRHNMPEELIKIISTAGELLQAALT
jgi:uncharacterized protein (DUF302 family)